MFITSIRNEIFQFCKKYYVIWIWDKKNKNKKLFFFVTRPMTQNWAKGQKKRPKFSDQKLNSTDYQQDNLIYKHIFSYKFVR